MSAQIEHADSIEEVSLDLSGTPTIRQTTLDEYFTVTKLVPSLIYGIESKTPLHFEGKWAQSHELDEVCQKWSGRPTFMNSDILCIVFRFLNVYEVKTLSRLNSHWWTSAKLYFKSFYCLYQIDSREKDFQCLLSERQLMSSQNVIKLFRDVIKRDFGGKVSSFSSRVHIQAEVSSGINQLNTKDFKVKRNKGWLLKSFKIKPARENNNFLSSFSLEQIVKSSFQTLTDLSLRGWFRIYHPELKKLKFLKSLDLSSSNNLNDESIEKIWSNWMQLEKINISYCIQLTEKSIKTIGEKLPFLSAIDFSSCYNVRPGCLKYLTYRNQHSHIRTIIANCLALESVDFQDIKLFKNLKTLSVSGWQLLDDTFISLLSKTKIENLDIQLNLKYTCIGIQKLLECLKPNLKVFLVDKVYMINKKLRAPLGELGNGDSSHVQMSQ